MTNRISFWICVAVALVAVPLLLLTGFSWIAVPLVLMHAPGMLAGLLLVRAVVLAIRQRPWALRVGERDVLPGIGGFAAPILFLLALTFARENGVVSLRLSTERSSTDCTTTWSDWRDEPVDAELAGGGFVVVAPPGVLGDAFAQQLRGESPGNGTLCGRVTLACGAPFGGWPLLKSAAVDAHVAIRLQLRRDPQSAFARSATIDVKIAHSCTMLGIVSRHDFLHSIGRSLAGSVRQTIDEHVAKAN